MFKNIESGIIFTVKSIDLRTIILGTKDGFPSMFVNPNDIESQFVPIIEDEVKRNPKDRWSQKFATSFLNLKERETYVRF